jgi:hypothetical protein
MDSPQASRAEDQPVYPRHIRRNLSRLEPFRQDIAAMRRANWPYLRIADWLSAEHGIHLTFQSVAKFCHARGIRGEAGNGIEDGGGHGGEAREEIDSVPPTTRHPRRRTRKKIFHYEERPLATRFNGRLPIGQSDGTGGKSSQSQ